MRKHMYVLFGELIWWSVVGAVLLAASLMIAPMVALGHENDKGFKYPQLCCGLGDCAPVTWMGEKDGKLTANTDLHSGVVVTPQLQTRMMPSPDTRYHICATPDKVLVGPRTIYCIFAPAGM